MHLLLLAAKLENYTFGTLCLALLPDVTRRAGAGAVGRTAVGVVLAHAQLPAAPPPGVDGARPVAVLTRVAAPAHALPGPGVAPEMGFSKSADFSGSTVFQLN